MKIYRFEIEAYEEIDIEAENKEEAYKIAEKEREQRFKGTFGDVEFIKEVKKPVTFMEAVESGKRVRVEHKRYHISSYYNLSSILKDLGSCIDGFEIKDVIVNGDWYIK